MFCSESLCSATKSCSGKFAQTCSIPCPSINCFWTVWFCECYSIHHLQYLESVDNRPLDHVFPQPANVFWSRLFQPWQTMKSTEPWRMEKNFRCHHRRIPTVTFPAVKIKRTEIAQLNSWLWKKQSKYSRTNFENSPACRSLSVSPVRCRRGLIISVLKVSPLRQTKRFEIWSS